MNQIRIRGDRATNRKWPTSTTSDIKKYRFEDTGATRVANFDIQNYKLSISSWKWVIVRIGGPGVILVNLSNNREVTIKEWRE